MQTSKMQQLRLGARVRYVGLSVMVARRGELGLVISDIPENRRGAYIEVAWDQGASSYCWPAELEVV